MTPEEWELYREDAEATAAGGRAVFLWSFIGLLFILTVLYLSI